MRWNAVNEKRSVWDEHFFYDARNRLFDFHNFVFVAFLCSLPFPLSREKWIFRIDLSITNQQRWNSYRHSSVTLPIEPNEMKDKHCSMRGNRMPRNSSISRCKRIGKRGFDRGNECGRYLILNSTEKESNRLNRYALFAFVIDPGNRPFEHTFTMLAMKLILFRPFRFEFHC